MRLTQNIAAAMTSSIVLVLVNIFALPFYLHYLGPEAYGLIGFYATLQTTLQALDIGLAPTLSREIAHDNETGHEERSASLLKTVGAISLGTATLIALLVAATAPVIAKEWLQTRSIPPEMLVQAITLMGINLAFRWPISIYHAALSGAHRLAHASVVSIAFNISAATFTVLALAWGTSNILTFFSVQAVFGLGQTLAIRKLTENAIPCRHAPYKFTDLRRVWKFSITMGGVSVAGLLLSQMDKLLLSRTISLEQFGHYMLASLLASGIGLLTIPLYGTMYPKFSALIARKTLDELEAVYRTATRLFTISITALASVIIFHSEPFLTIWLRDPVIAREVAPIASLLGIGAALNGVMYLPYILQLATGQANLAFMIACALLALTFPTTLILASQYGAIGGASAWVAVGISYLIFGTWLTGRHVKAFAGLNWLRDHVTAPALATLAPVLAGALICGAIDTTPLLAIIIGGATSLLGACLGVATSFSHSEIRKIISAATS